MTEKMVCQEKIAILFRHIAGKPASVELREMLGSIRALLLTLYRIELNEPWTRAPKGCWEGPVAYTMTTFDERFKTFQSLMTWWIDRDQYAKPLIPTLLVIVSDLMSMLPYREAKKPLKAEGGTHVTTVSHSA